MKTKTSPRTQLKLFETEKYTPPAKRTYSSLSIHEKINYKANQCGFQQIPFLSRYNYFCAPLHKPKTNSLTKDYHVHYTLNSGGRNRLDNWMKERELFPKRR